jgi:tRNA 2-thiouridine synthesizing protein A
LVFWYSGAFDLPACLLQGEAEDKAMNFDKEVDARGLNCPLPILRTKKALTDMTSGQVLRIIATDPGAIRDFQAFAKQTGNVLMEHSANDSEFTFFMQKK